MVSPPSVQIQVPVAPPAQAATKDAARKAAEDYESVFINELLSHMDQGDSLNGAFTGGQAESVYRSLFDDSVAKQISLRGGIGVANNLYREILKLQEAKDKVAAAPPQGKGS